MQVEQGTDDGATWRRSFAMYVPPDFDLFDFDDDHGASSVAESVNLFGSVRWLDR